MPTIYQRVCGWMVGHAVALPTYGTCDARPANHFWFSEFMSSRQFLIIKNIPLPFSPNQRHIAPVSPRDEGRWPSSLTRGEMRWTPRPRLTSVAEAYGEVVWFWRRGAGVKSAGSESVLRATEAKEPFSGKSTK